MPKNMFTCGTSVNFEHPVNAQRTDSRRQHTLRELTQPNTSAARPTVLCEMPRQRLARMAQHVCAGSSSAHQWKYAKATDFISVLCSGTALRSLLASAATLSDLTTSLLAVRMLLVT